ncbi:hypothetical protein PFISCL1PPCAC_113, partial [Pristionchus fissidentatus]
LDRCIGDNKDYFCFVRQSCISGIDRDKMYLKDITAIPEEECDVVVQIKPYSISKWHMTIQINGTELNPENGIEFFYNTSIFKCNESGVHSDVVIGNFTKSKQIFSNTSMFCSFMLTTPNNREIKALFPHDHNLYTYLQYSKNKQIDKLEYLTKGNA